MILLKKNVIFFTRLESLLAETDLKCRAVYLCLVHNCANTLKVMVPTDKTGFILPNNLKIALSNCLLDVALARLYQPLHGLILEYVQVTGLRTHVKQDIFAMQLK